VKCEGKGSASIESAAKERGEHAGVNKEMGGTNYEDVIGVASSTARIQENRGTALL